MFDALSHTGFLVFNPWGAQVGASRLAVLIDSFIPQYLVPCTPGFAFNSFLGHAHVLICAPAHLSSYDARQELPCCAEAGQWGVVGWGYSLLGVFQDQIYVYFS